MIPKKPAPDLIRGGDRFSENDHAQTEGALRGLEMARVPAARTGRTKTDRTKTGRKTTSRKATARKAAGRTGASRPSTPKLAIARRGLMLVLSSPSGAGKTTLSRKLLDHDPLVELSVSVTTRARRANEKDGIDYHFIDKARFDHMVEAGELLE